MGVCGVDHIEVTPDERSIWWRERKLRILAFRVDVSMELVIGAGDGESDQREEGKKHGGDT